MPIKLIGTIILLILVTIFAGVNLDNKCDITFIIHTFKDVPVFMTVIISFAIGLIVMLPFTFGRRKRKTPKVEAKNVESASESKKAETESKTLFDFKIKRDASPEKSEKKRRSPFLAERKSLLLPKVLPQMELSQGPEKLRSQLLILMMKVQVLPYKCQAAVL